MNTGPTQLYKNWRTGVYSIRVPIPGGKNYRHVATGERDIKRARAVVEMYGVDRIIHLALAEAVTAKTLSIVTLGRNFTCRQLFDLWKERLAVTVAPRSAETYGTHVAAFFAGLQCWDKPMAWVTEHHIHAFVNDGESHLSTANIKLHSVKSLFRFAADKGVTAGNPAMLVSVQHRGMAMDLIAPVKVKPFTEEEYQRLIGLPALNEENWWVRPKPIPRYWHDWAILGYCCGYRLLDCVSMQWASFGKDFVSLYPHKSRRAKLLSLPLADPMIGRPELMALIARLEAAPRADPVYIWPEHNSGIRRPTSQPQYFSMFRRMLKHAGIEGGRGIGVTFHSLRRAFAVRLLQSGRTLEQVGTSLGHANTATTQIYVDSAKNL